MSDMEQHEAQQFMEKAMQEHAQRAVIISKLAQVALAREKQGNAETRWSHSFLVGALVFMAGAWAFEGVLASIATIAMIGTLIASFSFRLDAVQSYSRATLDTTQALIVAVAPEVVDITATTRANQEENTSEEVS